MGPVVFEDDFDRNDGFCKDWRSSSVAFDLDIWSTVDFGLEGSERSWLLSCGDVEFEGIELDLL